MGAVRAVGVQFTTEDQQDSCRQQDGREKDGGSDSHSRTLTHEMGRFLGERRCDGSLRRCYRGGVPAHPLQGIWDAGVDRHGGNYCGSVVRRLFVQLPMRMISRPPRAANRREPDPGCYSPVLPRSNKRSHPVRSGRPRIWFRRPTCSQGDQAPSQRIRRHPHRKVGRRRSCSVVAHPFVPNLSGSLHPPQCAGRFHANRI